MSEITRVSEITPVDGTTKPSSFEVRSRQEDEMNKFKELDKVSFDEMIRELITGNRQLSVPFVSFTMDGDLWIQSVTYVSGIPKFSLKICPSQSFVAYRMGIECTVETLSKNRMTKYVSGPSLVISCSTLILDIIGYHCD